LGGEAVAGVKEAYRLCSVLEVFCHDAGLTLAGDDGGLAAERVLVEREHFVVGEEAGCELVQPGQVIAQQQGDGHQAPGADVRVLFIGSQHGGSWAFAPAYIADDHHIGIVPVARAAEGRPFILREEPAFQAVPVVADIAAGAPGIGPYGPVGRSGEGGAVGEAQDHVASAIAEGLIHGFCLRHFYRVPVVFQIIKSPGGKLLHVIAQERIGADGVGQLFFIAGDILLCPVEESFGVHGRSADMMTVGFYPGSGINTDPEAHGVYIIAEGLHVGEDGRVGEDAVVGAAAGSLPAVVDIHIGPAVVDEAAADHGFGICLDQGLGYFGSVDVPAVPAHRWGERDLFAYDEAEGAVGVTCGISYVELDGKFTSFGDGA